MTNGATQHSHARPDIRVSTGEPLTEIRADLLVFAVGYEQRSRFVAESFRDSYSAALGIRFGTHEELSYAENLSRAEQDSKVTVELAVSAEQASSAIAEALGKLIGSGAPIVIAFDVSSFPRVYIAEIFTSISKFARNGQDLTLHFLYSPAEFSPPPNEHGPVVSFGPVTPDFAGMGEIDHGLAAVIGLGYEHDLALAAQQLLDPAETWLAVPRSFDSRFDTEIASANEVLLHVVDDRNVWKYEVETPFASFVELESVVSGLQRSRNVLVVPLGPKLLVVLSLLVATIHRGSIGVWRLTAGGLRTAQEQIASGRVVSISAHFVSAQLDA